MVICYAVIINTEAHSEYTEDNFLFEIYLLCSLI